MQRVGRGGVAVSDVLPYQVSSPNFAQRVTVSAITTGARILSKAPPRALRRVLETVRTGARPASYRETRAARDVILTVSAYARGGSACLPRAIATALLCRVRGVWPEWCVGVLSAPPFTAHAWVEAEQCIVDEPMTSADFTKLMSVSSTPSVALTAA